MEFDNLLIDTSDGVATLTVNRPQALNALNSEVLDELADAIRVLERDPSVNVVVVTGAGDKAFVAGADIAEMAEMNAMEALGFTRKGQDVVKAFGQMRKPVIAAVNGYALGGGLEMALACDFIYASEKARFGLPEVTLGIMPGFGGTQNLARLIARAKANELIFTGRLLKADEARQWGIVNAVFPPEELLEKAMATARQIAGNGLLGVGHAKEAVRRGLDMAEEDGLRFESALVGTLFASTDQKEGMGAFLEKRKAQFTKA